MSRGLFAQRGARLRAGFILCVLTAGLVWWPSCSEAPTEPTSPAPSCTYSLSATSQSVPAAGGTAQITVSTNAGCAWTAQSQAAWLTLSASSFTGPGTVTLTAAANPSTDSRSASVTVAGQTVTVTQPGQPQVACVYAVSPDDVSIPAKGGSGEITVTTSDDCPWEAVSHDSWIAVAGTNPRKGPGRVTYTVDEHAGPVGRLGRMTVAGTEVLVHQAAASASSCTYKVEPTLVQLAWQHTSANVIVTTGDGCPWTAATETPWLTLTTPASMTGPGMASVALSTYKEQAPREGILQIRWPTETAGQNVVVRQFGCAYTVNPATVNVPAAGGRGTTTVFGATQASFSMIECPWRLSTAASWVRLNTTSGSGLSPVTFDVDANTTGSERCGTVVMSDPDVARASFQVCQPR